MAAYLIGHITVKDAELWDKYIVGVGNSLVPYKAEVVFRGKRSKVLAGKHAHEITVVIQFPDQGLLQEWYYSKEYQVLIPLRDKAAAVDIISYDS